MIFFGVVCLLVFLGEGIMQGKEEVLTALLPLPFFAWWICKRRVATGWLLVIWTLVLVAMIGSATGDFRDPAFVNRCTHAGVAALVTLIFFIELRLRLRLTNVSSWLLHLCAGSLLMASGALLEIGEAAVSWDSYSGQARWHDTILDLSANLTGAIICLLVIQIFSRHLPRQESTIPPSGKLG